ncbi:MAG: dienelactone hydrolase family protein, partial [Gemmatimonas sp.]
MSRRLTIIATVASATLALSVFALQRGAKPASAATMDDHSAHMRADDLASPVMPAGEFSTQQDDLKFPASNAQAAARLAATPRHGEWVKFPAAAGSTDTIMAWIVYPSTSAKAPVVVVVHEIFGLSSWVRAVADQVAAEGFIAIAPDFLSRVRGGPSSVELASDTARRLISGVDAAERNRVVAAAANYAMMQPAATPRYGVIGYCWGGQTTFMHTINGGLKGFSGGVAFYGLPYMTGGTPATATTAAVPASINADSLAKIKAPIMLLNGSKDARIAAAMPALDSIMKKLGKDYAGTNYDGAVHGFLRAQGDGRAPRAASATLPVAETEA